MQAFMSPCDLRILMDSMLTSRAQGLLPQTEQLFAISLLPLRNNVHIKDMRKQVTNGSSHFGND